MKRLFRFTVCFGFLAFLFPAQAAFTSLYCFGDGICTTTNNPGGQYYYGNRYCNGRVWVEVLAQQQGLAYDSNKNWSYYGQYSTDLVVNVSHFVTNMPPDAGTALFIVWAGDADVVYNMINYTPYNNSKLAVWTNALNQSLTNQFKAITNLYSHGVRTFVLPNAVDITEVPNYSSLPAASKSWVRQRVVDFNVAFSGSFSNQLATNCPGITMYLPNIFSLLDNVLTNAASYGMTNAGIDAIFDSNLTDKSLNGPGANYVFWDYLNPTARFQAALGGLVQQMISQPQITKITVLNGSNQLDVVNVPVGLDGLVYGTPDLVNWSLAGNVDSTNVTESIFLSPAGSLQFYRLYFPFTWTWP